MTEQDYKDQEENYTVLDKIDFIPYLEKETDLEKLMHNVSMDYDNTELTDNKACCGFTFNWFDVSEVENYLRQRYGNAVRIWDSTKTYVELKKNYYDTV